MRPQTTLDQAQLGLANLLNQNAVPPAEQSRRAFFITSAVERLYRAFDFEPSLMTYEVATDADGLVNLSDEDIPVGIVPAIQSIDDGIRNYDFKFAAGSVNYHQGDFTYWTSVDEDGNWILHSTEPSTTLNVSLYAAPTITNTQAAAFTKMVIAKGALIYYRAAQDPEADTSVEEDSFRQEVSEVIEAHNRRQPQKFAQSPRDRAGYGIGG